MSNQKPLIVIMGPTASGKSGLAVDLALRNWGEVISADSRQVYRGLDIGTEKITPEEMRGVPHHCIDIASPRRSCSVERWRTHAKQAIEDCHRRGTVPILAGGTWLYVDALVFDITFPPVQPDARLRRALGRNTPEELFAVLQDLDPVRAAGIERENPRRLIRAIETARALGAVPPLPPQHPQYNTVWIGIMPAFTVLEQRIDARLAHALARGLVEETRALHETLGLSRTRIDELGLEYRICAAYLRGEIAESDLHPTLVRAVRRYAKRQINRLKRYAHVPWYESAEDALAHVSIPETHIGRTLV